MHFTQFCMLELFCKTCIYLFSSELNLDILLSFEYCSYFVAHTLTYFFWWMFTHITFFNPKQELWVSLHLMFITFFYILHKKKVWNRENFLLLVYNRFTRSECPEHDFTIFLQNVCVCVWHRFCGCTRAKTDGRNCMKFLDLVAS